MTCKFVEERREGSFGSWIEQEEQNKSSRGRETYVPVTIKIHSQARGCIESYFVFVLILHNILSMDYY